jgi:hypothetical protein
MPKQIRHFSPLSVYNVIVILFCCNMQKIYAFHFHEKL